MKTEVLILGDKLGHNRIETFTTANYVSIPYGDDTKVLNLGDLRAKNNGVMVTCQEFTCQEFSHFTVYLVKNNFMNSSRVGLPSNSVFYNMTKDIYEEPVANKKYDFYKIGLQPDNKWFYAYFEKMEDPKDPDEPVWLKTVSW